MARVCPYLYKGKLRMKQEKCRSVMPLDKPRIWLDFNEFCAVDEADGALVYLFSQADIVNDSDGNDVELFDGMEVSVFDHDLDDSGRPDALLADGVVIRNVLVLRQYPAVKWLVRLVKSGVQRGDGEDYVYWMSSLSAAE